MSSTGAQSLKILMLHGYTQSGALFHAKTRALEKAIVKAFPSSTLYYPTGPIGLRPQDIPGYTPSTAFDGDEADAFGWWRRKDGTTIYEGIEKGLERVAETMKQEGPFTGVIGFSQGGAMAAMITSLLEPGRNQVFDKLSATSPGKLAFPASLLDSNGQLIQLPLKFAIIYSGFAAPAERYEGFYNPKINTPVLHFFGSLDTVVDESRGKLLVAGCEKGEKMVVVHPGGHFVPSQKIWLDTTTNFIRQCLEEQKIVKAEPEESVEDMDVPF
ncbi:MAG: hypothetical protein MMC33_006084 [Icmadophila ericetorum]|nr:hypothetical protein [Icmadophila ericetorum]